MADRADATPQGWRRWWPRLWPAALLLMIVANVLYFGGNAAIDLWQTLSPGQQFRGVITKHEIQNVGSNDNQTQLLVLTIALDGGGTNDFDVTQRTYDLTNEGQRVVGEQDSGGFLDHAEALRKLTANNTVVFDSRPVNRAINAIVILVVIVGAGVFFARWVIRSARRGNPPRGAPSARGAAGAL
jgi:hypothetical protein